jgi:hypothetical protein
MAPARPPTGSVPVFKDMPPYTACPVQEYSAARPPKEVSSRTP